MFYEVVLKHTKNVTGVVSYWQNETSLKPRIGLKIPDIFLELLRKYKGCSKILGILKKLLQNFPFFCNVTFLCLIVVGGGITRLGVLNLIN